MEQPRTPKLKPFNLTKILETRDRILDELQVHFLAVQLDAACVLDLAARLAELLKLKNTPVYESCRDLLGKTLDSPLAVNLAWRLAGNMRSLRHGDPVYPFTRLLQPEWLPAVITHAAPDSNKYGKPGHAYSYLMMAGPPTGQRFRRFLSVAEAAYLAKVHFGFNHKSERIPYLHPTHLVQLRFYGLFANHEDGGGITFSKVSVTPTQLQRNLEVIRPRYRRDPRCINGLSHSCQVCAWGYDECPAAVHPTRWTAGYCQDCGDDAAPFELETTSQRCILCHRSHVRRSS
jgi:hypothetical protein